MAIQSQQDDVDLSPLQEDEIAEIDSGAGQGGVTLLATSLLVLVVVLGGVAFWQRGQQPKGYEHTAIVSRKVQNGHDSDEELAVYDRQDYDDGKSNIVGGETRLLLLPDPQAEQADDPQPSDEPPPLLLMPAEEEPPRAVSFSAFKKKSAPLEAARDAAGAVEPRPVESQSGLVLLSNPDMGTLSILDMD